MKKLILGTDVNYASTAGGAEYTALTPNQLGPGSVGIFAIDPATSKNVQVNVTNDSTLLTAGLDEVVIAVGTTAGGPVVSQPISITSTDLGVLVPGKAPVADVLHLQAVGYNGTSGSMNFPTFADKDAAEIKLIRNTHGINQRVDKDSFEVSNIKATDTDYEVCVAFLAAVAARDENTRFVTNRVKILSNGTGAVFATSATVTAVNGATSLTTSAAHGVGVGDWVGLGDPASGLLDLYQAITGTASTTLVLDRPYNGPSATIANADTLDMGATVPTELGLEFQGQEAGLTFDSSSGETAEDATHTTNAAGLIGAGSALWIAEEVRLHGAYMGYFDQIDCRRPAPDFNVTAGAAYDVYQFNTSPSYASKDEMNATFTTKYVVKVGFVDGGSNSNQATFEAIMEVLYGGVTLTPA